MFWAAVLRGIETTFRWESAIAAALYFILIWVPIALTMIWVGDRTRRGLIATVVLFPTYQLIAVLTVTWMMAPIILAISDDAAWTAPWKLLISTPASFFGVLGAMVLGSICTMLVPLLGAFSTFVTLVEGGISVSCAASFMCENIPRFSHVKLTRIPTLWQGIGFMLAGAATMCVGALVYIVVKRIVRRMRSSSLWLREDDNSEGDILAKVVIGYLGLVPVFMYGAWLGQQMIRR
jgi:hypothetical protein